LLFELRRIAYIFEFIRFAAIGGLLWLFQDIPQHMYISITTGVFIAFSAAWLYSQRQYFGSPGSVAVDPV